MHGMLNDKVFTALIMLCGFQVPCEQLNISLFYQLSGITLGEFINFLVALPNPSAIYLFLVSDLMHFSVNIHTFIPCNIPPLELKNLVPLYPFHFNMCALDDDDLLSLSLASPQIESFFLGCSHYWSTPLGHR